MKMNQTINHEQILSLKKAMNKGANIYDLSRKHKISKERLVRELKKVGYTYQRKKYLECFHFEKYVNCNILTKRAKIFFQRFKKNDLIVAEITNDKNKKTLVKGSIQTKNDSYISVLTDKKEKISIYLSDIISKRTKIKLLNATD